MSEDGALLSVGFAIDFHDSFGQLRSLDDIVGDVAANVFREFQRVEQVTSGAINMGSATAQMSSFGNATSRAMADVTRDTNRAEKAAEAMIRQIDRQIEVFGKNSSEIRQMRAEMRAAAAEELGLTEAASRLRSASAQMDMLEASTGRLGVTAGKSGFALRQFGMQMPDIAQGLLTGQHPMQVFIQQGGQIAQIGMMAEGGLKGFAAELGALAISFAPLIAVAAVAVGGFALFDRAVSKGIDTDAMVHSLGLTKDEIKKLKDTSVTTGDVVTATFEVMAQRVGFHLGDVKAFFGDAMDYLTRWGRGTLATLYAGFVGTFKAIGAIVQGVFAGKSLSEILSDVGNSYKDAFNDADGALKRFGGDVTKQIASNKLADLKKQADALKADRTPKVDRHAEQLARNAAATEAEIKNLYALAAAYGVSGAAALIAEAREKAESKAIKQRGDIAAEVDRQIRLAVAQRVSDAAKSTAALMQQADIQNQANAAVASGNILASDAAKLVQDRIADLPLLAAIEAARATKDVQGIQAATAALDEQRRARQEAQDAQTEAARQSALQTGGDQLAQLREEARLIDATSAARVHALAIMKAEQVATANWWMGDKGEQYVKQQAAIADQQELNRQRTAQLNEELRVTAQLTDDIGTSMSKAFGKAGDAIGEAIRILGKYGDEQDRIDQQVKDGQLSQAAGAKLTANVQMNSLIDLTDAAKGLFKEHSKGYDAMMAAEKALTVVQLARTAVDVAGGAARMFASLGPFAFPAVAAMLGVMASLGFSGGGSSSSYKVPDNTGTGTVLGDASAQSASIKNAIDALKEVDTLTNNYAREMSASLKSIDSSIAGVATVLVRAGDINASSDVKEGFKSNMLGAIFGAVPLIGGLLGGLFGTKTSVIGSGLYGGAQSLGSILSGGFDASTYSDIKRKHKFFGITTGTSYSTRYGAADPTLTNQFTLILKQFDDAIVAAAGPLGAATDQIQNRLNGFVVNLGKIDLQGLTGQEIQDKLEAIFGAAADNMANAAFPGIAKFQKVGEGAFETLVRVASTVEAVTNALSELGDSTKALSIDAKMGLAAQFDSMSDMSSAVDAYFQAFYTTEEQATAKTAELTRVFQSLGLSMPSSLDAFRQLVDAQDLTTAAGQATYATLIKLAPAFADLQSALNGAKSAADIASERENLQQQLLQLQGDTAALRQMELAKLDPSNRALQEQIYAIQDAQDAAKAAQDLADAWTSVGNSIMDEVKRIRGLNGSATGGGFASLLGQFNAATAAARGGDQDAAKSLPQLSQDLLTAAAAAATSRQELDRIQAQTAASLEATYAAIMAAHGSTVAATANGSTASPAVVSVDTLSAAAASQPVTTTAANDDLLGEIKAMREEVAGLRGDNNAGHAATAGNTGAIKRKLDDVTAASGGDAISTVAA